MQKTTLEEHSAGGVVFRYTRKTGDRREILDSSEVEFLLGKHSGYHKWVLPKGLVERGETHEEAAAREVAEEVGVRARIVDVAPLKTITYWYYADFGDPSTSSGLVGKSATGEASARRVKTYQESPDFAKATSGKSGGKVRAHKTVTFYLMEAESDLGKEGWEMEERKWVSYDEGMQLLAFDTEREVFEVAGEALRLRSGL